MFVETRVFAELEGQGHLETGMGETENTVQPDLDGRH